jgi:hypothetical protein
MADKRINVALSESLHQALRFEALRRKLKVYELLDVIVRKALPKSAK